MYFEVILFCAMSFDQKESLEKLKMFSNLFQGHLILCYEFLPKTDQSIRVINFMLNPNYWMFCINYWMFCINYWMFCINADGKIYHTAFKMTRRRKYGKLYLK